MRALEAKQEETQNLTEKSKASGNQDEAMNVSCSVENIAVRSSVLSENPMER